MSLEDEKYYTPEINEFCIGFEFESKNSSVSTNGEWVKDEISDMESMRRFADCFDGVEEYRVKYLDRGDIESLGFEMDKSSDYYWLRYFNGEYLLSVESEGHRVIIEKDGDNYFVGTIKNKSELKKILKMLGV